MFLAVSPRDTFRQVLQVTQQAPRSLWDRNERVGRCHHSLLPSLYAMRSSAHASFPGHFWTFQNRPEVCQSYQCPIGLVLWQEWMRQSQCLLLSEATSLLAQKASWSLFPHLEKYGVIFETFQSRWGEKIKGTADWIYMYRLLFSEQFIKNVQAALCRTLPLPFTHFFPF